MIRAAAKNHAHVGVVTDPSDYDEVLDELRAEGASPTTSVAAWPARRSPSRPPTTPASWLVRRGSRRSAAARRSTARSRRRPSSCATARTPTRRLPSTGPRAPTRGGRTSTQHGGLALSYLNLFDADAAWVSPTTCGRPPADRRSPSSSTPTRAAPPSPTTLADAYQRAFECDPRSAFGGIVALSDPVDAATVEAYGRRRPGRPRDRPGLRRGAVDALLAKRKNTRSSRPGARCPTRHQRPITGGLLSCRTPHVPGDEDRLAGGHRAAADRGRVGGRRAGLADLRAREVQRHRAGQGRRRLGHRRRPAEPGRVGRDRRQEGRRSGAGGACASDAFYPFPDGIEAAAGRAWR